MTFLSPIPALIAAAITLPALLILYFLKLRRRPVRVSSTLLWQQATHDLQVNIPFRWIRPSLMLLLHLLILALFLLALARPAINMDAAPPARIILLIDRSASMSATDMDQEQSRLSIARQRAIRTLDTLARGGSNPSISIIAFAAEPRALTSFSIDRGGARAAINTIQPTDQPANLEAALRLAGTMLAGDADETGDRQRGLVILFSDGVLPQGSGYTLGGADFRFERIVPSSEPDNLGIVALSGRRDWEDPGLVRIFARIQNASNAQIATSIALSLDGREVQRKAISVPAATAADEQSRPTPGAASITFDLATREAGIATVSIIREDALTTDNTASLLIAAATKPRILLVVPDQDLQPDQPNLGWVLTGVLDEMELPYRRTSASAFASDLASREPLRADMIILDRVRPPELPPLPSLSFGAAPPLPGLEIGEAAPQGTYFLTWQRTHPLLRHVSLDAVYVSRPLTVSMAEPAQLSTLARGRGGPLILLSESQALRRVIVAFDLAYSNWPTHFGFPIFIASAVDHLTFRGDDRPPASFTTSEPVRITVSGGGTLALQGPRQSTVEIPQPRTRGEPTTISLGVLDRAGIYRIGGEIPGAPPAVAVNLLSEPESALYSLPALRVAGETISGAAAETGPREIWHWFVIAALVLLALEWFLSAWLMRA